MWLSLLLRSSITASHSYFPSGNKEQHTHTHTRKKKRGNQDMDVGTKVSIVVGQSVNDIYNPNVDVIKSGKVDATHSIDRTCSPLVPNYTCPTTLSAPWWLPLFLFFFFLISLDRQFTCKRFVTDLTATRLRVQLVIILSPCRIFRDSNVLTSVLAGVYVFVCVT